MKEADMELQAMLFI